MSIIVKEGTLINKLIKLIILQKLQKGIFYKWSKKSKKGIINKQPY